MRITSPGSALTRRRGALTTLTLGVALLLSSVVAVTGLRSRTADAMAGCLPHANTSEEMTFLSQLQAWRNQNIPGSVHLTLSGPLNAAAAGYAQYLANTPGAAGHNADGTPGYAWAARAVNCGYPSNEAAGGEGLATLEGSGIAGLGATQALTIMTSEQGGGVWVWANLDPGGPPAYVACVGVAKMSTPSKVAWVTLLFATWDGTCPQAVIGGSPGSSPSPGMSPSVSPSPSATPTDTATPTNTPTPTPTATPLARYGASISLSSGWNLVALPAGSITDVLGRAGGCFTSVYQQQGNRWLRYSPLVPDYANNLSTSTGGAFWINGTGGAGCSRIQL